MAMGRPRPVLTYLLGFLAAGANATASVLQRKANKEIPQDEEMSLRLVRDLLHNRSWFGGIAAVTCGFLLQATALGGGELAVVEPILILELPMTILLAWLVFHGRLTSREWFAVGGMTVGLGVLIYALSPSGGRAASVPLWIWLVALGGAGAVAAALVWWGRRTPTDAARAAIYGVATGLGFGVTAALMKGMTAATAQGFAHIFLVWQTYAMVTTGAASMYLLQNAVNAGRLVAAQPGLTLTDPVVSVLWGVLVFHERVRGGGYAAVAAAAGALVAGAVVVLVRSPLLQDDEGGAEEPAEREDREEPAYGGEEPAYARHETPSERHTATGVGPDVRGLEP